MGVGDIRWEATEDGSRREQMGVYDRRRELIQMGVGESRWEQTTGDGSRHQQQAPVEAAGGKSAHAARCCASLISHDGGLIIAVAAHATLIQRDRRPLYHSIIAADAGWMEKIRVFGAGRSKPSEYRLKDFRARERRRTWKGQIVTARDMVLGGGVMG